MKPKTEKKPKGMAGKVKRAIGDLRKQYAAAPEGSAEQQRIGELLAMTEGDHPGEVFDDPMNQGERTKRARRPKLF